MANIRELAEEEIKQKTKPEGSLGDLEDWAVRLAVLQGTLKPNVDNGKMFVFASDHGISLENVSKYPRVVTKQMLANISNGGAAINVLCRANNLQFELIDVGVDCLETFPNVTHSKVLATGTRNFAKEKAMTLEEVQKALQVGKDAIKKADEEGIKLVCLGELGIGNTTSASALLSLLSCNEVEDVVGRGTGIDDAQLEHKTNVIKSALKLHNLNRDSDPLEILATFGGCEIAAIAGAVIEGHKRNIAIIVDGFISMVSVLSGLKILSNNNEKDIGKNIFLSHVSAEKGSKLAAQAIQDTVGFEIIAALSLGMRLGEGSGAAIFYSLLKSSAHIMAEMATFQNAGVSKSQS